MMRRVRLALRLFWGGLATLLIGLALLIELGRQLLPQISEWREDVEFYLSRQVGQTVKLGQIQASWEGLSPELQFDGLVITTSAGQNVLQVGRAEAKLDLLRSLREMTWRLQRMEIDSVAAELDQAEDGRWSLAGFKPADHSKPFQLDPLELLLFSDFVQLGDTRLTFDFRSGRKTSLGLTRLLLQNDYQFHRLTAELELPDNSEALRFVYEGKGIPGRKGFSGQGYLALEKYPLVDSIALASEDIAAQAGVRDGLLSTRLWLQAAYNQAVTFAGALDYQRQELEDGGFPRAITAALSGHWHPASGWELGLQQTSISWQKQQPDPFDVLVKGQFGQPDISLLASQLDLQYWQLLLRENQALPEVARRILGELNVRGQLSNVHVRLPLAQPADFVLRANIEQLAVNDWKGAPQIANLDGYLEARALSGRVQLDSHNGFLMHFPQVYRLPFEFDSATGEVTWQVLKDTDQVLVNSGLLSLQGDLGTVNGYFYLDAPLQRDSRLTELILQLGIQSGKAIDRGQLMPFAVPDDIESWVNRSILKGDLPSAGFVLQGTFGKQSTGEEAPPRSIQLALNIDRASLLFHDDWPELENFSGFLQMDAPSVSGWIDSGEFLGAQLTATRIEVAKNPQAEGQLLAIRGQANGSAAAGLKVLTTTPLRQQLGAVFDDWQLSGDLSAAIELDIPLLAEQAGHRQAITVTLDDVALGVDALNLTFTDIDGELQFTTAKGLSAEHITASLWGEKINARISSPGNTGSAKNRGTQVQFDGKLDFAQLAAWTRRPELLFLEGKTQLDGALSIAEGKVNLRASTNLSGVAIDLPAPLGKTEAEQRRLSIDLPIDADGLSLHLDYANQLFANLDVPRQKALSGVISFGKAEAGRGDGVWITGSLPAADGQEWRAAIDRYQQLSEKLELQLQSTASEGGKAPPLLRLDAKVESFHWGDVQLADVQLGGGQLEDGWLIRLGNEKVAGNVRVFTNQRIPEVNLDYLRWQYVAREPGVEQGDDPAADLLQDVDPAALPALKIRVQELRVNDEDYGQWSLYLQPVKDGLIVGDIRGAIRHLAIAGNDADNGKASTANGKTPPANGELARQTGAELFWQKAGGVQATGFKGVIRGRNLVDVTDAWQLPRLLESKSIKMTADLRWQGSPSQFSATKLEGNLDLALRDGRFYQSTGQASSAFLRLVGLFNFDSWTRRLQLDFSDVYKGGLPFEKLDGGMRFAEGVIYLDKPIEVDNTSSQMQMGGRINLADETLDTSLVATLPVGGNATFLAALIGGLPAAAGVYLASKIFEKQMEKMASLSYRMEGPWSEPRIRFDKLFDNQAAENASKDVREDSATPQPTEP